MVLHVACRCCGFVSLDLLKNPEECYVFLIDAWLFICAKEEPLPEPDPDGLGSLAPSMCTVSRFVPDLCGVALTVISEGRYDV